MNAGMGVIHSERPPHDIHELGGVQEIIQLWINTPANHKMDQPFYFPVQANEVPSIVSPDGLITVNVFAGNVLGVAGKIPAQSPVNAATIMAKQGGKISIEIPASHNV